MTYNKEGEQMTSERALWELMHNAFKTYNKDDIFRLRAIKRDLEILYMLKKNMRVETEEFENDNEVVKYEYIAYNGWDLDIENKEEYNKLREWLLK